MTASTDGTGWTFGVELEWPDVDTRTPLPDGWAWSVLDFSIVNSNGTANDPRRKLVRYGGELNSPPYTTPHDMAAATAELWSLLRPGINYRSNLHIHIRVPGLLEDLAALLRLTSFTRLHLPRMIDTLDPLAGLLTGVTDPAAREGAVKRLKHSKRSRHYFIPEARHQRRLAAPTVMDALYAEYPRHADGSPVWHIGIREAVNVQSLRKHNTVEFRCFAAPTGWRQVLTAAVFARTWLLHAFNEVAPPPVPIGLPRQLPYDHRLETGWRHTTLDHQRRGVVAARLQQMGLLDS